jgi:hypothetical protein
LLASSYLLAACAEGIGSVEDEYIQAEGGLVLDGAAPAPRDGAVMSVDTGMVTQPSKDAGNVGPTEDVIVPTEDAGATEDAGTSNPTEDSGAEDAGTSPTVDAAPPPPPPPDASTPDATVPPPMDAGPDTSTPPPMDAALDTGGGSTDTGTTPPDADVEPNPNQCSATPAYPTTTSCARCTCMKCGSQVSTCFASTDATKNTQCARVQACAEQNKCTQRSCYCGNSATCLSPSGPCVSIIEQVAGGGALSVARAEEDPNHALGRASLIGACQITQCKAECGL